MLNGTLFQARGQSCLTLSKQAFNALIQTLQSQAKLIKDLFEEGYDFIIPARFQTDPLEKRFSQYRQMGGQLFNKFRRSTSE